MTSGIYSITNLTDGKRYIGRAVDTSKRWAYHQWLLNSQRHFNPHLQRAWNRGDQFDFSVIEECRKEDLNDREIYWIAHFKTTDMMYGYNLCIGGQATTGRKFSEETKRKISESNKGRKVPQEVIDRRRQSLFEHFERDPQFKTEHSRMISERFKGRVTWNRGRVTSEETKKKLSASLKGKKKPKSQGEKLRKRFSGEGSVTAKLKEQDVVRIRLRFLSGERQCDIRKDYPQITTQTLNDIVRNRRWKSVPNTLEELEEMERKYGTQILADA